jgi:hypothetical protein
MADPVLAIDAQGLTALARDIKKIADRDMTLRMRKGLKTAGEVVATAARSNAGWSTRIPGSTRVGVTQRGVYVRAGGPAAPHAVTFEGKVGGGARKHPVFATGPRSSWTWVAQSPRSYLQPALAANLDNVERILGDELENAFRDNGWR